MFRQKVPTTEIIYCPMTCNILTVGHIKLIEKLSKKGKVLIGILTSKALRGYKKEIVAYKDRQYILKVVASCFKNVCVVPQNNLNPSVNIKKYKCTGLASGDGFEQVELDAIKKYHLKKIRINSGQKLHSSDILINERNRIKIRY